MRFLLALLPLVAAVPSPREAVEPLAGFVAAEDGPTAAASATLLGRRSADGSRMPLRVNKRSGLKHRRPENDDRPRPLRYRSLDPDLPEHQVESLTAEELNLLIEDTDYFVTRSSDERIKLASCIFKSDLTSETTVRQILQIRHACIELHKRGQLDSHLQQAQEGGSQPPDSGTNRFSLNSVFQLAKNYLRPSSSSGTWRGSGSAIAPAWRPLAVRGR